MKLIDADALPRHGQRKGIVYSRDIDNAPIVDAVPVVRCRDCRWWIDGMQRCGITISATPYGHCHDGETWEEAERKDNG